MINEKMKLRDAFWLWGHRKDALITTTETAAILRVRNDFYREKIMAGETEGVVFHTHTMIEPDYPACDAAVKRMEEHATKEWLAFKKPNFENNYLQNRDF